MNRRDFLTALSLTAAAGAFAPSVLASTLGLPRLRPSRFSVPNRTFPLIFTGEAIDTMEPICTLDFFEPWFGSGRTVVNPAEPRVARQRLVFMRPGEYYLRVNDAPLKVLVFPRGESTADAVLRIFDFGVANNIYFGAHDGVWYEGRRKYLEAFFYDDMPMILSCGPTHQMFRMLVRERLGLPTRISSAAGAFYTGGTITRIAHNVPEIYIPEAAKFAMFDLNSGYVAKWLDTLDVAERIRSWGSEAKPEQRIEDLGVPIHSSVAACPVSQKAYELLGECGDDGRSVVASRDLLAIAPLETHARAQAVRAFYSGTGYWGKKAGRTQPHGTEFLEGDFQFVLLETDPELRELLVRELAANKAEVVPLEEMRARLAHGMRSSIERQRWTSRFCADDERGAPPEPYIPTLL